MSNDIVNQMMGEMKLSPSQLEQLNQDTVNMAPNFQAPQFTQPPAVQMPPPASSPATEESYSGPPAPPVDDDAESYDDEDDMTEQSEVDLAKLGLDGNSRSWVDRTFKLLRDPLLVAVIFVILNLVPVDKALSSVLPAPYKYGIYLILVKALVGGAVFFGSRFVFQ